MSKTNTTQPMKVATFRVPQDFTKIADKLAGIITDQAFSYTGGQIRRGQALNALVIWAIKQLEAGELTADDLLGRSE